MPFLKQDVPDTWSPVWLRACVISPYVSAMEKQVYWKMASSLFPNTSEGLLGMGYTIEVLVIFFPGWPFHVGQALKESALSSECCPVLSTRAASPLFAEMSWCLARQGALRGHKISTRPVGIANNLAIM